MNYNQLLRFFPVPKYLELSRIGVDISDNSMKYVELVKVGNRLELGRHGKKLFDSGEKPYLQDETIDDSRLLRALSEIKEKNCFEAVNVSLPEDQAYFLRLRLPALDSSQVREAIELQIENHVPFSLSEIVFDYEIVDTGEKTGHVDVTVSVAPKTLAEKYLRAFKLSNMEVSSLTVESEAAARVLVPRGDKDTYMAVNMGKNKTVISIINNGTVWMSSTVKAGGDLITGVIIKYLKVSFAVADGLKYKNGLLEKKDNLVFEPIALGLSSIRDEIQAHQNYWKNNKETTLPISRDVKQIILCGKEASIPGIDSYLSSSLRIATVVANPWVNILNFEDHVPSLSHKESLEYVNAIGLALNSV